MELLEERRLLSVNIEFDYTYDYTGFFDDPNARQALEAAGRTLGSLLNDDLEEISTEQFEQQIEERTGETVNVEWTAEFTHPDGKQVKRHEVTRCDGEWVLGHCFGDIIIDNRSKLSPASEDKEQTEPDLFVPEDTLIVFVGVRNEIAGDGDPIGRGGPGGFRFLADEAVSDEWEALLKSRGRNDDDFGPWGGRISFERKPNGGDWHFGLNRPPGPNETDFYSLAVHELGHVLGIGTADSWFDDANGKFSGKNAMRVNGGNPVPLEDDAYHWKEGTQSKPEGIEAAMDPSLTDGVRKPFTALDRAALQDIGWSVSRPEFGGLLAKTVTGKVTDSSGNGIGGAIIEAQCLGGTDFPGGCPLLLTPPIIAHTDSSGRYTGSIPWEGDWALTARRGTQVFEVKDTNLSNAGLIEVIDFQAPGGLSLVGAPAVKRGQDFFIYGDDATEDDIRISRTGGSVQANVNGNARNESGFSRLVVEAESLDDSITLDFTNGTPIPEDGTLSVFGGTNTNDGQGDQLLITGGDFPELSYSATGPKKGTLFGGTLEIFDVENVRLASNLDTLTLQLRDSNPQTVVVEDDGNPDNNRSQVTIDGVQTFVFENPSESLILQSGGTGTAVVVNEMDPAFSAAVDVTAPVFYDLRSGNQSLKFTGRGNNIAVDMATGTIGEKNGPSTGLRVVDQIAVDAKGANVSIIPSTEADRVNIFANGPGGNGQVTFKSSSGTHTDVLAYENSTLTIKNAAAGTLFDVDTLTGEKEVIITGNGANRGSYRPSSQFPGDGVVDIGGSELEFRGFAPAVVSAMAEFTFVTPNTDDRLTVDSPIAARNRIQGTSGDVPFESLTFFDVADFTVDLGVNDGESPDDSLTIAPPGLVASGLETFIVNGGEGNDEFHVMPSLTATLAINGGPPAVDDEGVPPGDILTVDMTGGCQACVPRNVTSGTIGSSTHQPIHFNSIETLIASDRFEVNDSIDQATLLGSIPEVTLRDLSIHGADDVDLFQVTAHETGAMVIRSLFQHEVGDIGLRFRDADGNVLTTEDELGVGEDREDDKVSLGVPVVAQKTYFVEVFGVEGDINNYGLEVETFGLRAPSDVILVDDTGTSDDDLLTNDTKPGFLIQATPADALTTFLVFPPFLSLEATRENFANPRENNPGFVMTLGEGAFGLLDDLSQPPFFAFPLPVGFPFTSGIVFGVPEEVLPNLPERTLQLSATIWVFDGAGNTGISPSSEILSVTIDATAPERPEIAIDPASRGAAGEGPPDLIDFFTSETTPRFVGTAEANSIVRVFADVNNNGRLDPDMDVLLGDTVATPDDLTDDAPSGSWRIRSMVDLNDPAMFETDGPRTIFAIAEDRAGNTSRSAILNVFLDTRGPQVADVSVTGETFNVFARKGSEPGRLAPTPVVDSLDIDLIDQPRRLGALPASVSLDAMQKNSPRPIIRDERYPAVSETLATMPGHYHLEGDHHGVIPIESISFIDETAAGDLGRTTVQLHFAEPLPDDRFTLTVSDALADDIGNPLDGESNAAEPQEEPLLPSGDGVPGGDFVARFTVDSRPEIGVTAATRIYVDINGNFVYDPSNPEDATNRDLVFQAGLVSDAYFSGDFNAAGDAPSSGFDKIGVFGWDPFAQEYRFLLDLNDNGVPDVNTPANVPRSALPVAGDFVPDHPGDEIGLFMGDTWVLDNDGDNIVNINDDTVIQTDMRGVPIVGDVNGDGTDDLITYDAGDDVFSIDLNRDGVVNDTIAFGIPDFVERPVVGDLNLDGIDDLGLWVAGSGDKIGEGKAEWYFLVSDRVPEAAGTIEPSLLFDEYSPKPLGNDLFANFGDRHSLPIFGNFDPPVADAPAGHQVHYTNAEDSYDVNGDSFVTPIDALLVIRHLNAEGSGVLPEMMAEYDDAGPFLDVTRDGFVSPIDALTLISYLNEVKQIDGEVDAEGESRVVIAEARGNSTIVAPTIEPGGDAAVAADMASAKDMDGATQGSGDNTITTAIASTTPLAAQATGLPETESDRDALFHATPSKAFDTEQNLEDVLALIADDVEHQWWKS